MTNGEGNTIDKRRREDPTRSTASCTECQRRKQKASTSMLQRNMENQHLILNTSAVANGLATIAVPGKFHIFAILARRQDRLPLNRTPEKSTQNDSNRGCNNFQLTLYKESGTSETEQFRNRE